jgi:hypothetical protein
MTNIPGHAISIPDAIRFVLSQEKRIFCFCIACWRAILKTADTKNDAIISMATQTVVHCTWLAKLEHQPRDASLVKACGTYEYGTIGQHALCKQTACQPQDNIIVVVQGWTIGIWLVIIAEIEAHVKE